MDVCNMLFLNSFLQFQVKKWVDIIDLLLLTSIALSSVKGHCFMENLWSLEQESNNLNGPSWQMKEKNKHLNLLRTIK